MFVIGQPDNKTRQERSLCPLRQNYRSGGRCRFLAKKIYEYSAGTEVLIDRDKNQFIVTQGGNRIIHAFITRLAVNCFYAKLFSLLKKNLFYFSVTHRPHYSARLISFYRQPPQKQRKITKMRAD